MSESTWFKVVRPDMGSFVDPEFKYRKGRRRRAPQVELRGLCRHGLLHASPTPEAAAVYGGWPFRLWRAQPDGPPIAQDGEKAGFLALTLTEELPIHLCWGPNGEAVERVLRRVARLTAVEAQALKDTPMRALGGTQVLVAEGARQAAQRAARRAGRGAAQEAAWTVGWYVACAARRRGDAHTDPLRPWPPVAVDDALAAQCVADLAGLYGLTQQHIDALMKPWLTVVGEDW